MPLTHDVSDELRGLMAVEKRAGARLRLQENTVRPQDGPLRLTGRDSRGHPVHVVGDVEFLCMMLRRFPAFETATA
jgi:hypothetical protein